MINEHSFVSISKRNYVFNVVENWSFD